MKLPVTKKLLGALSEVHVPDLVRRGMPKHTMYRILRGDIDYLNSASTEKLARALHLTVEQLWHLATTAEFMEKDTTSEMEVCYRCQELDEEALALACRYQALPERWRGKLEIRLEDIEHNYAVNKVKKPGKKSDY